MVVGDVEAEHLLEGGYLVEGGLAEQ